MRGGGLPHHHESPLTDANMVFGLRPEISYRLHHAGKLAFRTWMDRNALRPQRKSGRILALARTGVD